MRLVQCVAQKGGVLSNPVDKGKGGNEEDGSENKDSVSRIQVQAHPIVGWKGFEDVVSTIPGETVDIVQNSVTSVAGECLLLLRISCLQYNR